MVINRVRAILTVLAYRFAGDTYCRAERFEAFDRALGDRLLVRTLPDSAAAPGGWTGVPHSVVTTELIDEMERQGHGRGRDLEYVQLADGEHNEATWARALPGFLEWALPARCVACVSVPSPLGAPVRPA